MGRILEPDKPLVWGVYHFEILPGQDSGSVPVIPPEQEKNRHLERSIIGAQLQTGDFILELHQGKAIAAILPGMIRPFASLNGWVWTQAAARRSSAAAAKLRAKARRKKAEPAG